MSTRGGPSTIPSTNAMRRAGGGRHRVRFIEEDLGMDPEALANEPLYPGGVGDIPANIEGRDIHEAVRSMHEDITGNASLPKYGAANVTLTQDNPLQGDQGGWVDSEPTPAPRGQTRGKAGPGRLACMRMIKAYEERFGEYFPDSLSSQLEGLERRDEADLEELLSEVKYCVFSKTQPGILKSTYFALVEGNEHMFGADGLHARLKEDQHIIDLLDEVNIKYQHYMYVEPEYRLIYCTLAAGAITRKMNQVGVGVITAGAPHQPSRTVSFDEIPLPSNASTKYANL